MDKTGQRNVVEPGQRHVAGYRDICLGERVQATERGHVVGGEDRVRQRAVGQHRQTGAVAGGFVEAARVLHALRLRAKRSERIAKAAQAFACIEVQRRATDKGDTAVSGAQQMLGHGHGAGVVVDA